MPTYCFTPSSEGGQARKLDSRIVSPPTTDLVTTAAVRNRSLTKVFQQPTRPGNRRNNLGDGAATVPPPGKGTLLAPPPSAQRAMLEVGLIGSRKMESSIETSFYPDDAASYLTKERMRNMKKTLTLDLESPSAKRQKFSLLSSPDLNMLKLGSPELENLIIQQQNGHVTTTPTPGQFAQLFARTVTEEQEMYARGFVDALAELQQQQSVIQIPSDHQNGRPDSTATILYVSTPTSSASPAYTTTSSSASPPTSSAGGTVSHSQMTGQSSQQLTVVPPYSTATSCAYSFSTFGAGGLASHQIKEEPQTVPPSACSSPPMSPIDMMAQERIKLERKRQRNRVAASKCRKRKLERIARLEHKVSLLKNENSDLGSVIGKLKENICGLKQQLMEHVNSGCHILTPSQY